MTEPHHASPTPTEQPLVRFGVFELDAAAGELRRRGVKIKLQDKPLRMLEVLVRQPGRAVTREELRATLWPADVFVGFDHSLNSAMNKLREALGDSASNPRFIETLPRGYRFIAPVTEAATPPAESDSTSPQPSAEVVPERWWRDRIPIVVLFAVAVLVAIAGSDRLRLMARPSPARVALVVLPFQNLSADPEQEFFSDGFTDEMIAQVGKLDPARLHVIGRTSAMHYKGTTRRIDQIGSDLGVDYILNGSVFRVGSRVRITAQLVRVRDQAHLWAQSYERDLKDVLALQTQVARTIAEEIQIAFDRTPGGAVHLRPTVNPDVYEAYLKGRYFLDKSPGALQKGIDCFQRALALDSTYAPAYAGLADAYGQLGWGLGSETPPTEAYPKALAAAKRALELDEGLATAHVALGRIRWKYEWNWSAAEDAFKRAIELDPSSTAAHESYFDYLSALGRNDEAFVELKRAAALDPVSLTINYDFGLHFARIGDYTLATEHLKKALDLDPTSGFVHHVLGELYAERGMLAEAKSELLTAIALSGEVPHFLAALAHVRTLAGDRDAAVATLERINAIAKLKYVSPYDMALLYTSMGRNAQALTFLEQAHRERDPWLSMVKVQPRLASLVGEPRFQAILERIGLGRTR